MNAIEKCQLVEIENQELISISGGAPPQGGDRYNLGNVLGCGAAQVEEWITSGWDSIMSNFMNKPGSL
jgi:hypothetical protein